MAGETGRSREADSAFEAANMETGQETLASYMIRVTVRKLQIVNPQDLQRNDAGENVESPQALTNDEVERAVEHALTRPFTVVAARSERTDR